MLAGQYWGQLQKVKSSLQTQDAFCCGFSVGEQGAAASGAASSSSAATAPAQSTSTAIPLAPSASAPASPAQTDSEAASSPHRLMADGLPFDLQEHTSPYRTLESSNYLRLYDQTPKKPQARPGARQHFSALLENLGECTAHRHFLRAVADGRTVAEAALMVWTEERDEEDDRSFFENLNLALLRDDPEQLPQWMLFVRLMTNYLTRPSSMLERPMTCFRGSKLCRRQVRVLREGMVIRPPMFVACSESRDVACQFLELGRSTRYLIELRIPACCNNACCPPSVFDEAEILLPPYTPLRIRSIERQQTDVRLADGTVVTHQLIVVDVLDGLCELEKERRTGRFARAWPV
jgi:hypothetical protein